MDFNIWETAHNPCVLLCTADASKIRRNRVFLVHSSKVLCPFFCASTGLERNIFFLNILLHFVSAGCVPRKNYLAFLSRHSKKSFSGPLRELLLMPDTAEQPNKGSGMSWAPQPPQGLPRRAKKNQDREDANLDLPKGAGGRLEGGPPFPRLPRMVCQNGRKEKQ